MSGCFRRRDPVGGKWRALCRFVVEHDVDTDCLDADLTIFGEEQMSNLYIASELNRDLMSRMLSLQRHQKIMGKSFATGFQFFYWKWHRTATEQDVKGNDWFSLMDFGGRSVQELSVYPHFDNLKEEALATGQITPKHFEKAVVQKAAKYMKTKRVKRMTSRPFGRWLGDDPLHFGIPNGTPVSQRHLHCMILYCDFTELCSLFSESLRQNAWDELLEDIKKRNGKFFYLSKGLRELVTYFGCSAQGDMNGQVKGPFYSGVSVVLNISEFSIGFNTPTSTSKSEEVALRFAGSGGMMLTVGNEMGQTVEQPVFDATWISAFAEEDEYFWFGSIRKLNVQDIIIVLTATSHRRSLAALYLFDAALSGMDLNDAMLKVSATDIEILTFCIKHTLKEELPPTPKCINDFVLDSFYAFCQKKTKILLNPFKMRRKKTEALRNLIFHKVARSSTVPTDRCNVIRPILFKLFPNLVEIEQWTSYDRVYPLNPLLLVSVLAECDIPQSFKVLKLWDDGQEWILDAFDEDLDVKKQYIASGWTFGTETVETFGEDGEEEDWVFIRKLQEQ